MISVQNLLQRLSGNKVWLLCVLILGVSMTSCGGTKKATSRTKKVRIKTRPTKSTTKKKSRSEKVDTVKWTEAKDKNKPPIVEAGTTMATVVKEDVYDITYLLPLEALSYTSGTKKYGDKFIQYFSGMEMAKTILEREGISIDINVVDSEKRSISSVLSSSVDGDTDAIVGLYDTGDLKEAAEYAKDHQIPLISPWKASSKITKANPYYVQLRPNLNEYFKTIVKDIKDNYRADQVYILGRNTSKDKKMVKYFQRLGKAYYRSTEDKPFREFEVDVDSLAMGVTAFDTIFNPAETNVVIIPNWSFSDESYIYGCVRRLTVEKGISDMVVYGMELLLDSEKITFDHYSALKMKVARTKFVDQEDGDVKRFKRKFYELYGALPSVDAYEGYDNLMFIGRNIYRYGKNFQYHLEKDGGYYLQAAYDVQKKFPKGSDQDDFKNINYFENKHVDIISFDGRRFHRTAK